MPRSFIYRAGAGMDVLIVLGLALTIAVAAATLRPLYADPFGLGDIPSGPDAIGMAPIVHPAGKTTSDAVQTAGLPYIDMFPARTGNPLALESDAFINMFGDGDLSKSWYYAHYRGQNHYWVDFIRDNVVSTANGLDIYIREKAAATDRFRWTAGQLSSRNRPGFGRYEAIMKPAYGSGLVSSFFTYTGPYFGDPHDEIDFEFVGRNPRQVEINSFRNGRRNGYKRVNLWFDATADYHLYAYEWRPDSIRWFVNGRLVGELVGDERVIPQTPGAIYLNLWSGRPKEWHGRPTFGRQAVVSYACVSYRPLYDNSRSCSDFYEFPDTTEALR